MYWVTVFRRFDGKIFGVIFRYGPYHTKEEAKIALEDAQKLFPNSRIALEEKQAA